MTFTSEVRNKEPVDKLTSARPGQRVWAHLLVRNRSDWTHTIKLAFSVNGQLRTTVDLDVASSWSYRTWGYVTLRPTDGRGVLTLRVTDDEDSKLVTEARLPISGRMP
jgi:hypothetical protein